LTYLELFHTGAQKNCRGPEEQRNKQKKNSSCGQKIQRIFLFALNALCTLLLVVLLSNSFLADCAAFSNRWFACN